ncbi:MAG TPA: hypothetical protein VIJ55_03745 [Acetobacteraceae bacterium]
MTPPNPDRTRLEHLRGIAASLRGLLLGTTAEAERVRRERDLAAARITALARARPPAEPDADTLAELASQDRALATLDAEATELTARWRASAMLAEKCGRHLAETARRAA